MFLDHVPDCFPAKFRNKSTNKNKGTRTSTRLFLTTVCTNVRKDIATIAEIKTTFRKREGRQERTRRSEQEMYDVVITQIIRAKRAPLGAIFVKIICVITTQISR